MKIVFHLSELSEDIEDAAGVLFEANGGVLGDKGLTLTSINTETQELLFTLADPEATVIIDMSPSVSSDEANPEDAEIVAGPNA